MVRNVGGRDALTLGHKSQRDCGRLGWASAHLPIKPLGFSVRLPRGGHHLAVGTVDRAVARSPPWTRLASEGVSHLGGVPEPQSSL